VSLATLSLPGLTASASLGAAIAIAYLRRLHLLLVLTLLLQVLRLGLAGSRVLRQQRVRVWANLNGLGESEETVRPGQRRGEPRGNSGGSWLTSSITCGALS